MASLLISSGRHGDVFKMKGKIYKHSTNSEEIKILKSLDHPNIIKIYNVNGRILEMDYIPHNLLELIKYGIPTNIIQEIIVQIARGLAFIHEKDIQHHDLKPENILIDNLGIVKLIDFPSSQSTIFYMSPEEAFGGEITSTQDIWALGCVGYEMIHKRVLFHVEGEIPLICAIFGLLGTPTIQTWPDWKDLPDYGKLQFNFIEGKGFMVPATLEIIKNMLSYCDRPKAGEIVVRLQGCGINKPGIGWNDWIKSASG
eukprot:NODE_27_length_39007_cov_1.590650.p19 type:complete len:256 gc:universal NODE_27_length_39007_cov_1.590650:21075-20308(-)